MTIDYDTWLLEGSDDGEADDIDCPICLYHENDGECDHDENAIEDWLEVDKGEAMYEAACKKAEKMNEEYWRDQ